jgi:RNA polymerase sigma-70 factor (ECF subfamily)
VSPIEPDPIGGEVSSLVDRAVAGDQDAAGELVSLHDERLRRIVRARLDPRVAQRVDPDDVLQDVHAEALSRLPAYAQDRSIPFFLWMRFLAVQRCAALARRHLFAASRDARREATPPAPDTTVSSSDLFASHLAASATSPSATASRREVHLRLRAALDVLDPIDRDVVWLRHFEALDNGEVAAVLSIAAPAASKRYVRALARLREMLGATLGLAGPSGS